MVGDGGLSQAERCGQVAHARFLSWGVGDERHQADSRGIGQSLEECRECAGVLIVDQMFGRVAAARRGPSVIHGGSHALILPPIDVYGYVVSEVSTSIDLESY